MPWTLQLLPNVSAGRSCRSALHALHRHQSSRHPAEAAPTRNCFGCTMSQTSAWTTAPRLFTCLREVSINQDLISLQAAVSLTAEPKSLLTTCY